MSSCLYASRRGTPSRRRCKAKSAPLKIKSFARLFKGGRGCRGAKPPCEKWNAKRSSGKMSKQWRQTIRWMVCRNAFAVPQAVYVWPDSPLAESLDESLKCAPTMNRPQIVPASRRNADRKKILCRGGPVQNIRAEINKREKSRQIRSPRLRVYLRRTDGNQKRRIEWYEQYS